MLILVIILIAIILGYLHIVGRAKDFIIPGGDNIYTKEVELLFDEQEGILEAAVVGVPHPDFGEGIFAIIVPSNDNFYPVATLEKIQPSEVSRRINENYCRNYHFIACIEV